MQCGVLRADLLLNLPSQSRMVRQGSLGLRAELDSGDDVLGLHVRPAIRAEPLRNDENASAFSQLRQWSLGCWPVAPWIRVSRCASSYLVKKGSRSRGFSRTGAA
jgi:hypothetical protein